MIDQEKKTIHRRILLLGGTGARGEHLTRILAEQGDDVYVTTRSCRLSERNITYVQGNAHEITFTDRHIAEENPTAEELREWIGRSGLEIRKFFNTSGMKYRELGLKDRLADMSDEEKIALLAQDGMLVKRPLVVTEERILVGFKEKEWEETLLKN